MNKRNATVFVVDDDEFLRRSLGIGPPVSSV